MTRWEYQLRENLFIEQINELGKEGWELCGIRPSVYDGTPYFYFKRPLPPAPATLQESMLDACER